MQNQERQKRIQKIYTEEVCPSAKLPRLTRANLRRSESKDPVVAALASFVSSLPPSETTRIPGVEVANAKVKARRRAAMKAKGKDAALGTMFGAIWGDETFKIPYGEMDRPKSAESLQWVPD